MKRHVMGITMLALALAAGTAGATSVGVGVFGGASVPLVQDDTGRGNIYGLRVPINLLPLISVEPFYASSAMGDKDQTIAGLSYTRDGGDITAFGVNAMLGGLGLPGVKFYPFAGIANYSLKRTGNSDVTDMGYDFGLGLAFSPVSKLQVNVRGEFVMVATDETSRKFGNVTLGASYNLFSAP